MLYTPLGESVSVHTFSHCNHHGSSHFNLFILYASFCSSLTNIWSFGTSKLPPKNSKFCYPLAAAFSFLIFYPSFAFSNNTSNPLAAKSNGLYSSPYLDSIHLLTWPLLSIQGCRIRPSCNVPSLAAMQVPAWSLLTTSVHSLLGILLAVIKEFWPWPSSSF